MEESQQLLNTLVSQLGKTLQLDDLALDDDGFCSLGIDDRLTITLHSDQAAGTVVLSTELGPVLPDQELALLRTMLRANYAWRQTGGLGTLSLTPEDEDPAVTPVVCLMHQTPLLGLDDGTFGRLFDQFLETAEAWQDYLHGLAEDDAEQPESLPPHAELDPSLRRV